METKEEFKWDYNRDAKFPNLIRVINCITLRIIETNILPMWKLLIAKWLKIPLEKSYYFKLELITEEYHDGVGAVLGSTSNPTKWRVIDTLRNTDGAVAGTTSIVVENMEPLTHLLPSDTYLVLYKQFGESYGKSSF